MDIVTLPIIIEKEKLDSRFRMVVLATDRARQIMRGARPAISTKYIKASTIALEELSECQIDYITGKEARKAIQEAASAKVMHGIGVPGEEVEEDETKKEIEKDLGVYMQEPGEVAGSESGEE